MKMVLRLFELSSQGIKTNITLCFDPSVATIFAQQGANYVSMILEEARILILTKNINQKDPKNF